MKYVVVGRRKWNGVNEAFEEAISENKAIEIAMSLFKKLNLQLVLVLTEKMAVVYRQKRHCRCANQQLEFDNTFSQVEVRCMDCNLNYGGTV